MTFENLSETAQNIYLHNYFAFGKAFWFFAILSFSLIYIFYWKQYKEEKTPFFSIGVLRTLMTSFCYVSLIASPFMMIMLDPTMPFWSFFSIWSTIYGIFITLWLVVVLVDIIYFSSSFFAKMSGVDLNNKRIQDAYRKIFKKNIYT